MPEYNVMEKNKKVGLAVNIIVTIILLAVSAYLIYHFYSKGMETGFRKGKIAGWNEGYKEAQDSMMEFVLESSKKSSVASTDTSMMEMQLDEIKRKLDDAEWQRKFGN